MLGVGIGGFEKPQFRKLPASGGRDGGADNYTALSIIFVQSPHSLPKKGEKSALGVGMRRKSRMAPELRAKIRLRGAVGCVWAVMRRPKAGLAMDGARHGCLCPVLHDLLVEETPGLGLGVEGLPGAFAR